MNHPEFTKTFSSTSLRVQNFPLVVFPLGPQPLQNVHNDIYYQISSLQEMIKTMRYESPRSSSPTSRPCETHARHLNLSFSMAVVKLQVKFTNLRDDLSGVNHKQPNSLPKMSKLLMHKNNWKWQCRQGRAAAEKTLDHVLVWLYPLIINTEKNFEGAILVKQRCTPARG